MSFTEKFHIDISSFPKLKNPKFICGLPGSGFVGKLAVDFLVDKLKANHITDVYSTSFPPQVTIQKDGTVDLIKNSLFHCTTENQDLILFTGGAQPASPSSEYDLANEIVSVCKKLNVDCIYTLAAYITGTFPKIPRVYGTGTSNDLVKEFSTHNVLTLNKGSITGMNGIIVGVAKQFNINGICLLGETSGYVIDAKASKAVLEVLTNILNIKLDMTELDKRIKDTEQILKTLEEQAALQGSDQQKPISPSTKNLGYIS